MKVFLASIILASASLLVRSHGDHDHDHEHDDEIFGFFDNAPPPGFDMSASADDPPLAIDFSAMGTMGSFGWIQKDRKSAQFAKKRSSCEHMKILGDLEKESLRSWDQVSPEAHIAANRPTLEAQGYDVSDPSLTHRRRLQQTPQQTNIRFTTEFQFAENPNLTDAQISLVIDKLVPSALAHLKRAILMRDPVVGAFYLPRQCAQQATIQGQLKCTQLVDINRSSPPKCVFATHSIGYFGATEVCDRPGTTIAQMCRIVPAMGSGATNTDVLLYVTAYDSIGSVACTANTIAIGGFCTPIDTVSNRPLAVNINFCPNRLDPTDTEILPVLLDTAVHEIIHGLAFTTNLYTRFRDANGVIRSNVLQSVTLSSQSYSVLATPQVTQVVQAITGCTDPTIAVGGILENDGPLITTGVHWDQRFFNQELMIGVGASRRQYFSHLTLALFEDSGWYTTAANVGERQYFGNQAGCSFFQQDCKVPSTLLQQQGFCVPPPAGQPAQAVCGFDRTFYGACANATLASGCGLVSAFGDGECNAVINQDAFKSYIGQSFGPQARCIEYSGGEIRRRGQQLFYNVGCFKTVCRGGAVVVQMLGTEFQCPSNGYVNLTAIPGLEFTNWVENGVTKSSILGPCPDAATFCPNVNCEAQNDCNGNGRCINGVCSCFIGNTGDDCSIRECTAGEILDGRPTPDTNCASWQTCNVATGFCQAPNGTPPGAAPPPPNPPPPPPVTPPTSQGWVVDGPIRGCQVFNDVNGNKAADVFEFQASTNVISHWTVRSDPSIPIPTYGVDPTLISSCRNGFTGSRQVAHYYNSHGGNLISPVTTVYSRAKEAYYDVLVTPNLPADFIRQEVQTCLGISTTINALNDPSGSEPMRILALTPSGVGSEVLKKHLFVIMALGNGVQMLTPILEGASAIQPANDQDLANIYARRADAADALIDGIAHRCFTNKTFDVLNAAHWQDAMDWAFIVPLNNLTYLNKEFPPGPPAINQCCIPGRTQCCAAGPSCKCNVVQILDATASLVQINQILLDQAVGNVFKTGGDTLADMVKAQFLAHMTYANLTRLLVSGAINITGYRNETSTASMSAYFLANTTFDFPAAINALGISLPAPPPPPRLPFKADNFFSRVWPTHNGLPVYVYIIFLAIIIAVMIIVLFVWRCLSKQAAIKAHETDEDVMEGMGELPKGVVNYEMGMGHIDGEEIFVEPNQPQPFNEYEEDAVLGAESIHPDMMSGYAGSVAGTGMYVQGPDGMLYKTASIAGSQGMYAPYNPDAMAMNMAMMNNNMMYGAYSASYAGTVHQGIAEEEDNDDEGFVMEDDERQYYGRR